MSYRVAGYLKDIILIIISSFLLVISFPRYDLGAFAWVSLAPFFLVITRKSPIYAFILSTMFGIFFFTGIFQWILVIRNYTLLHHALLAIYLGLYFGLFGLIFSFICLRRGVALALFATPFIWVSLEYLRSNLSFLALPWGLLGHSQYQHPLVIQIAALVGTYGVSFLIVMVNSAIVSLTYPFFRRLTAFGQYRDIIINQKPSKSLMIIAALLTTFTLIYGYVITSRPIIGKRIRISAVQGNIKQSKKFDPRYADEIMRLYTSMTREAAKNRPNLIIWPETATPGSVNRNSGLYSELKTLVNETSVPVLTGSAEYQKFEKAEDNENGYFNSAVLFEQEPETEKPQRYNKIRLFPFGEYLPYKGFIPWSMLNVPELGHYIPGEIFTVFHLPDFSFGATICWENIFADLVRRFVRQGAEVIINITNEGHFGKTAAPYQLAAISVFRAVENRIFVIRCGNTGISCIIDPYGRIINRVKNDQGEDIFIRGVLNGWVVPMQTKTFYTEFGELAVWIGFLGAFIIILFSVYHRGNEELT